MLMISFSHPSINLCRSSPPPPPHPSLSNIPRRLNLHGGDEDSIYHNNVSVDAGKSSWKSIWYSKDTDSLWTQSLFIYRESIFTRVQEPMREMKMMMRVCVPNLHMGMEGGRKSNGGWLMWTLYKYPNPLEISDWRLFKEYHEKQAHCVEPQIFSSLPHPFKSLTGLSGIFKCTY